MEPPAYRAELRRNLAKAEKAAARWPEGRELLADGQEEVFSRTEVERGEIEHQVETHRGVGKVEKPG